MHQAKAAAGDRDVMMHGAYTATARQALKAGVLNAIEIRCGRCCSARASAVDGLPPEHIELELVRALQVAAIMHLRYQVLSG